MTDPSQREFDDRLEESMDLFHRADVGAVGPLKPIGPSHVLIAFDGSQQDEAALSLALVVKDQQQCRVSYCLTSDSAREMFSGEVAERTREAGASEVQGVGEADYDRILDAAATSQADLLIVPCPFGRDYESIGEDSTGTVVDVLLARCPVPFIAIRELVPADANPTKHVRLVFTGENPAAPGAAQHALGLAAAKGRIDMLLLVETSFYEGFRAVMHSIDPERDVSYEDLEHALARSYGRLHAALHRTANERKLDYELLIRHEEDEDPITPRDPQAHAALPVLGLERGDHDSQAEARDYIRRSPHPVLVTFGSQHA